jgi:hypothetical protein
MTSSSLRASRAGQLLRVVARRRTELGPRRGARREARGAGQDGDRDRRRRLVHVQRAYGDTLGLTRVRSADPHRDLQQPRVERGEARGALVREGRLGGAKQRDAADRPRSAARHELVCRASGGWAEQVTDSAALPDALARALKVEREEKRQALLNVIVKKPA